MGQIFLISIKQKNIFFHVSYRHEENIKHTFFNYLISKISQNLNDVWKNLGGTYLIIYRYTLVPGTKNCERLVKGDLHDFNGKYFKIFTVSFKIHTSIKGTGNKSKSRCPEIEHKFNIICPSDSVIKLEVLSKYC